MRLWGHVVRATSLGAALLVSSWANAGAPQPPDVAMLPIEAPNGSARVRKLVERQVEAGLARHGWAPTRVAGAAQAASADYVMRARIESAQGVYRFSIEVRDGEGATVGRSKADCEICGLSEVGELVADRSAALAAQVEADRSAAPILRVTSEPDGSEVWLDDKLAGLAPVEVEVSPGSHVVELRRRGYVDQRRTLSLESGVEREIRVRLSPAPKLAQPAVEERRTRSDGRRLVIGGAATSAAGIAMLSAGAALLIIDGRSIERDCSADPMGNCARLHDTSTGGVVSLAVGAASAVAGVAMLAVGLKRRGRSKERVSASVSGLKVRF